MTNDMTRGNPTRLIISFTLPVLFGNLCQQLYGMVDSIIVGRAISMEALAAVGATSGISFLVIGCIQGLTAGFSVITAQRFGAGDYEGVKRSVATSALLSLAATVLLTAAGILTARPLLEVMNTPADIIEDSYVYIIVIYYGVAATAFYNLLSCIIRALGDSKTPLIFLVFASFLNVALDLLFIITFHMGVGGAAWATVIGQFCGMAVGIGINHVKNHEVRLNFRRFRPDWHSIKGIYQVGLPSIIMQSIGSVMTFGMNKILIAFTETAVSVFGVYFKLQSFVFMPVFGVTNALVPIVGYNYGARSSQRIQQATRLSLLMTTAIMALGTVIFQVAPGPLLSLFSASDTMLSIGIPALRIISVSFCFAGVAIVFSSVFQALGDGMLSLVMSAVRQLLLLLPCAFVLAKLGGLDAVWFSFLIAEVASVTLAVVFYRSLYNKKIRHI